MSGRIALAVAVPALLASAVATTIAIVDDDGREPCRNNDSGWAMVQ